MTIQRHTEVLHLLRVLASNTSIHNAGALQKLHASLCETSGVLGRLMLSLSNFCNSVLCSFIKIPFSSPCRITTNDNGMFLVTVLHSWLLVSLYASRATLVIHLGMPFWQNDKFKTNSFLFSSVLVSTNSPSAALWCWAVGLSKRFH